MPLPSSLRRRHYFYDATQNAQIRANTGTAPSDLDWQLDATAYSELAVHARQVLFYRTYGDVELVRYLIICVPAGRQHRHSLLGVAELVEEPFADSIARAGYVEICFAERDLERLGSASFGQVPCLARGPMRTAVFAKRQVSIAQVIERVGQLQSCAGVPQDLNRLP